MIFFKKKQIPPTRLKPKKASPPLPQERIQTAEGWKRALLKILQERNGPTK